MVTICTYISSEVSGLNIWKIYRQASQGFLVFFFCFQEGVVNTFVVHVRVVQAVSIPESPHTLHLSPSLFSIRPRKVTGNEAFWKGISSDK